MGFPGMHGPEGPPGTMGPTVSTHTQNKCLTVKTLPDQIVLPQSTRVSL